MTNMRAGIVGAGIAGASCAGVLAAAGWEVDVYDKARGAGGRLASRRLDTSWAALGSPFISTRRDPFRSQLREWARQGWLVPVRGNILRGSSTLSWSQAQLQNHYRPLIEPSQLVRNLMHGARLHPLSRVERIVPRGFVLDNGETRDGYDCVVCSVPLPQALPLLDAVPRLQERLPDDTGYRPLWSFIVRWQGGPAADVIQFDDDRLELAVRQPDGDDVWAVHSTHVFAETWLDVAPEEVAACAASALMEVLGLSWLVEVEVAHLWKLALPTQPLGGFWLSDREHRVALIGDGIAGAGVERAWESGTRLAQALLQAQAELVL